SRLHLATETSFRKPDAPLEGSDPRPETTDQSDAASSLRSRQRYLGEPPPSSADQRHEYFRGSIAEAVFPRSPRVYYYKLEQKMHRQSRRTDRHNEAFLSHEASGLPRAERN